MTEGLEIKVSAWCGGERDNSSEVGEKGHGRVDGVEENVTMSGMKEREV